MRARSRLAAEHVLDAGAVSAGRGAEDARERVPPPRDARCAAASGFSSSGSSRAATARTAASSRAICAGNRSRNKPEMRQVTSTRGRPIVAVGSTSMPVTRPVAWSQVGRQPISARPCAISSPPVRSVALPHRSMTSARGISPCVCRCVRITSSAASRPKSIAVGVGSMRGSAVKRLRPVGSTSRRPRAGAPAGPGATRRPSSAPSRAERSAAALACHDGSIVVRCGRAAVDVQAVLDGEVLEVAQPGIDAAQRLVGTESAPTPASRARPGALRGLDDQPREPFAPPAVEAVGLRIFVDQPLELARLAGQSGRDQRRRQVADGHGRDAALGLRGLARIADDERIDHRQRADQRLGEAGRRQRHRLARQPFERAVRAHDARARRPWRRVAATGRRRAAHGAAARSDRGSRRAGRSSARGRAGAPP